MKKYPAKLATITATREAMSWLYDRAESCTTRANEYRTRIEQDPEENGWYADEVNENEAMVKAFTALADSLCK